MPLNKVKFKGIKKKNQDVALRTVADALGALTEELKLQLQPIDVLCDSCGLVLGKASKPQKDMICEACADKQEIKRTAKFGGNYVPKKLTSQEVKDFIKKENIIPPKESYISQIK